jgi:aspartate racemase
MKLLGLIGGMSWESTVPYYCQINQAVKQRLGGLHSARLILYSVDFHELEQLMRAGDWDGAGAALAGAARTLEAAGAQGLVLCTNTLHRVAPAIELAVRIPLLHIIDATAAEILRAGLHTIGLLGTRFTMEQPFYRDRLQDSHGLRVVSPGAADREILHAIIFEELCLGRVEDASRREAHRIMAGLVAHGAQAIILGCTELSMLIGPEDASVPLFDTTAIHARRAVDWALAES